ncbi:putative secreted protein (Por secretion system target) [Winogradskyella wandonensis]|uniref:Putative secreted protein (Por secretion system target) n=1 Tax=Winogradskyella wandonensis TaxID=1442586 RepID=A0A4R1KJ08_9FLAO|nr:LamG-like jellyroll fold domain-containing protein [Winogradskyella wandonensis]TCK64785.1 putative secreted protein (Por secretion system target) [Winogradskyella wandonensis]
MKTKLLFTLALLTNIAIQAQTTAIPDSAFEQRLIDLGYDDVIDGQVITSNINTVTTLDINGIPIVDLTGIEDFNALEFLYASNTNIVNLDLSSNSHLLGLGINSTSTSYESIDVSNTNLYNLGLSLPNLLSLNVSNSNLHFIEVRGLPSLNFLDASYNANLSSIVVSNSTNLTSLNLSNTNISALNLTFNELLSFLDVSNTNIPTLISINNCIFLSSIDVSNTNISVLDVGNNVLLTSLNVSNTNISVLDVYNNVLLTSLNVSNTGISTIQLNNNYDLSSLDVSNTNLSSLNLSNNTNLSSLDVSNTSISSLNVSSIPNLNELSAENTAISVLDLSFNPNLLTVKVDNSSSLTELNIQNGNNINLGNSDFSSTSTPNLLCIQVDNVAYSTSTWNNVDTANSFSVNCNITYIPDNAFEQRLIDLGYDDVIDGEVLTENINTVATLNINDIPIADLTGIEDFSALENLFARNTSIVNLDLSSNSNLEFLSINTPSNSYQTINVSNTNVSNMVLITPNLSTLDASSTNLSSLNVSSYTNLSTLDVSNTSISTLDLSSNSNLSTLDVSNTNISTLDASNTLILSLIIQNLTSTSLTIVSNNLSSLDVSSNTNLSNLDVSSNTNLSSLTASGASNLSNLNLSNTNLSILRVNGTAISGLDLSLHTNLTRLAVSDNNNLTELNVQNGTNANIIEFSSIFTPNLSCIQVDDVAYSNSNWNNRDAANNFSTACPCPQTTIAQNITAELDANGEAVITEADVYTNFLGGCVFDTVTINPDTFTCDDLEFEDFSRSALELDGTLQYAEIPYSPELNLPNSWTLEGWIYPTGSNPGGDVVIDKWSGNSFFDEYSIFIFGGNYFAEVTTTAGNFSVNGGPVTLNQWTHIAGVYDQTNGTLAIYINGVLQNTVTDITGTSLNTTNNTILGGVDWGNATFTGTIDELRIWDRALTAQEIADQRSQILSADEANLVGYFRIEQGPGNNTLLDSSPNNNNANFFNLDSNTDWNTLNTATVNGEPGVIPVILNVTDSNNNSSITPLQVKVVDNIGPNVITQDVTVTINCNNPMATITVDAINNGSTDNCQILNIDLDMTTFDETNLGENTVTLTVTDTSGNTNSNTAIVTVITDNPNRLYVNQTATGSNTGESWENAFTDLQSAIDRAATCSLIEEIWVAKGTYTPSKIPRNSVPVIATNFFDNRNFSFHLVNNVAMYGGFSGNESSISERDLILNSTILSGDIGIINDNTDNILNIITSVNDGANTIVNGFIIEDGNSDRLFPTGDLTDPCEEDPCPDNSGLDGGAVIEGETVKFSNGGAIQAVNSSIKVENCIFRANNSAVDGCIYFNLSTAPLISNSLFYGNTSGLNIITINQLGNGAAKLNNLTFVGNSITQPTNLVSINNTSTINNCVFYANSANNDLLSANGSSTNNFVTNNVSGTGTLLTTDPFVNSTDIDGPDDILGTEDDGLFPAIGSAIENTGIILPETALTDIFGRTRIVGLLIDVGAYESQGATLADNNFNLLEYSIYPNPATNLVYINGLKQTETVEVYNINGQKLFEKSINQNENSIDVTQLSSGIYFIKLKDQSLKFIKQ